MMSLTVKDIQAIEQLFIPFERRIQALENGQVAMRADISEIKDMILELTTFVKHESVSVASYARLDDHERRISYLESKPS